MQVREIQVGIRLLHCRVTCRCLVAAKRTLSFQAPMNSEEFPARRLHMHIPNKCFRTERLPLTRRSHTLHFPQVRGHSKLELTQSLVHSDEAPAWTRHLHCEEVDPGGTDASLLRTSTQGYACN